MLYVCEFRDEILLRGEECKIRVNMKILYILDDEIDLLLDSSCEI